MSERQYVPSWIKAKTCYVIMPFSTTKHSVIEKLLSFIPGSLGKTTTMTQSEKEWTDIFERFFKPTLKSLGYDCYRSKASVGLILKQIVESIHSSEVMLADLTGSKPNVFYELGIAHSITNNVIMISQDSSSIPSDLKPYGVVIYDPHTKDGAVEFMKNISQALHHIQPPNPKRASPVYEFLGKTHRFLEPVYEIAVNPVSLLECAKCHNVYDVQLNDMSQGGGDIKNLCGHWEPAIFRGLKGVHG